MTGEYSYSKMILSILLHVLAIRCLLAEDVTTPDVPLVFNPNVVVHDFDYCSKPDICARYSFSQCVPTPANNLFECLCPTVPYLQVESTVLITDHHIRMQTCSVNIIACKMPEYACKDSTATCHFQVETVGNRTEAYTFCSCPNGLTLPSKTAFCSEFDHPSATVAPQPAEHIQIEAIKYCENPQRCSMYPYTKCVPKVVQDSFGHPLELFECLCIAQPFIELLNQTTFYSEYKLRMESCSVRDMCKADADNYGCSDDAQCHFHVESHPNGNATEFTARSYCTCPSSGLILPDKQLSCKNADCLALCNNNAHDCAFDLYKPERVVCNCKDGWTGERCNRKH